MLDLNIRYIAQKHGCDISVGNDAALLSFAYELLAKAKEETLDVICDLNIEDECLVASAIEDAP